MAFHLDFGCLWGASRKRTMGNKGNQEMASTRYYFVGLVLILMIGVIDYLTGYEVSFCIFYLLPVTVIGWFRGRTEGFAAAVISAVVWLVADVVDGHPYSHPLIPLWNALVRLSFFGIVVQLMGRLRVSLQNQERLVLELQEALVDAKVLAGLLPICAWCKNVRDDEGFWRQVENYIEHHTEVKFTHGMCPRCAENFEKKSENITSRPFPKEGSPV